MKIPQSERKTIFVTFYSFKGGVGRTMALVNAACILAGRGRRVLMIDFDMEAPGLTMLAMKQLIDPSKPRPAGLVDLIHDFLQNPLESPITDKEHPNRYATEYVCPLNIPEHVMRLEGGRLELMPCGRLDSKYAERLYTVDFDKLYAEGIGQPLFMHLKNVIRNSARYDYVLIDSRTGLSDEGGISTRDLADHIMVFTGLNRQNIDGTVYFLTRLKDSGWQGKVLFVLSPIPAGYEELVAERMDYARQEIETTGFNADFKVFIYYHPRLALDEEPFVYPWTNTSLFYAHKLVCEVIQELADDAPQIWVNRAIEAFVKGQIEEGMRCFNQVQIDDILKAPSARYTISSILMLVISQMLTDDILAKQKMIQDLVDSLQTMEEMQVAVLIIMQYVEALLRTDNLQTALEYLDEKWDFIQSHASANTQADAYVLRGQIRFRLGNASGALEDAEAALKFYHDQDVHTQKTEEAETLLQKAQEQFSTDKH